MKDASMRKDASLSIVRDKNTNKRISNGKKHQKPKCA